MAVTEGKMRIKYTDASMTRQDVVFGDVPTTKLDISTDPRQMLVVPYQSGAPLKEDDMMVIALKGLTAGTFDSGSSLSVPVTIRNITTGIVREAFLEMGDFTDMAGDAIDADDESYGTSFTDVMKYTVKAQEQLRLGHKFAENSRIYLALVVT